MLKRAFWKSWRATGATKPRSELAASVGDVAARVCRAVAASGSPTGLDVRSGPRGAQDRRWSNDHIRLRRRRLSREQRQRARRSRTADDPFVGESVMAGEGLNWDDTVPAQVGALMKVQSASLAVHGFATDQSYLYLESELPRFQRPVAVVTLFMPALLGPESRRQSSASRTRIDLAAAGTAHAAHVARNADRAVSPRDDGRARHRGDVRSASRDRGACRGTRRHAPHRCPPVQSGR